MRGGPLPPCFSPPRLSNQLAEYREHIIYVCLAPLDDRTLSDENAPRQQTAQNSGPLRDLMR